MYLVCCKLGSITNIRCCCFSFFLPVLKWDFFTCTVRLALIVSPCVSYVLICMYCASYTDSGVMLCYVMTGHGEERGRSREGDPLPLVHIPYMHRNDTYFSSLSFSVYEYLLVHEYSRFVSVLRQRSRIMMFRCWEKRELTMTFVFRQFSLFDP